MTRRFEQWLLLRFAAPDLPFLSCSRRQTGWSRGVVTAAPCAGRTWGRIGEIADVAVAQTQPFGFATDAFIPVVLARPHDEDIVHPGNVAAFPRAGHLIFRRRPSHVGAGSAKVETARIRSRWIRQPQWTHPGGLRWRLGGTRVEARWSAHGDFCEDGPQPRRGAGPWCRSISWAASRSPPTMASR